MSSFYSDSLLSQPFSWLAIGSTVVPVYKDSVFVDNTHTLEDIRRILRQTCIPELVHLDIWRDELFANQDHRRAFIQSSIDETHGIGCKKDGLGKVMGIACVGVNGAYAYGPGSVTMQVDCSPEAISLVEKYRIHVMKTFISDHLET